LRAALELLAQDAEARPLAGGATLVAMMNARVLEPRALVSLGSIAELRGIRTLEEGTVRIGAFTRHSETAADPGLSNTLAVVREAAGQIANATVRNMGTIGGSVAFADPGLDYPPALVAANARIEMTSLTGVRSLSASEFFVDWYTTALLPGELVSAVLLPAAVEGVGRYHKLARVAGDYAIVSVAITRSSTGAVRVAVGGCGPTPLSDEGVNTLLSGAPSTQTIDAACARLVELADPVDDVRGSAAYRRQVMPRMLRSALGEST
ncbi:MAG: xanthine dehydrogenase family protein subunit M, partial [Betaproteobacteria bacterium]|nr:xanthine dehydrogenase family protein subunit M [Betaproteobacteria bacterium]